MPATHAPASDSRLMKIKMEIKEELMDHSDSCSNASSTNQTYEYPIKSVRFCDDIKIVRIEAENEDEGDVPSGFLDNRPFFICNISISDGKLVAIVEDSVDETAIQWEVPVRTIKHRICELKEAVERLNQQYKYIRFDQDVIKFVKEVTGKSPIELRNERKQITVDHLQNEGVKRESAESSETLNNLTEQSINESKSNGADPFDVAVVKEESADYPSDIEIEKKQDTVELELNIDCRKRKIEEEEEIDVKRIKAEAESENELYADEIDEERLSSAKLIDFGFLPSSQPLVSFYGEMVFLVQWGTGEKTWQPWAEFKDNTDLIFKLVLRFIRKHFTCNAEEKKLFESKTGVQLHCDTSKNRSFFTRIIYIPSSRE